LEDRFHGRETELDQIIQFNATAASCVVSPGAGKVKFHMPEKAPDPEHCGPSPDPRQRCLQMQNYAKTRLPKPLVLVGFKRT
jgi:hypothetical protein